MKENLTQIVFILDRSGSMDNLTNDTIGGFNSFVKAQKEEPGEAMLTTVLFDDKYEILHDNVNIQDVEPLTSKEYYARGMTALLDAIGKTIKVVGGQLDKTKEEDKPSKVIFVITTDGWENSSKEFIQSQIKEMIKHQQEVYNWEFLFTGAGIDAVGAAVHFGIRNVGAAVFATPDGIDSLYSGLTKTVSNYRSTGEVAPDWSNTISENKEENYAKSK